MTHVFPINYIITSFSGVKSFTQRHNMKVWQMIMVVILIHSLMMIPLSLQLGRSTGDDLSNYVPQAMNFIDQSVVDEIRDLESKDDELVITTESILKEDNQQIIALAPSVDQAEAMLSDKVGIIFTPKQFIISEEAAPVFYQPYTGEIPLNEALDVDGLKNLMSQQWYWSNRSAIVLTNYIYLNLVVITSELLIIAGASFLLSFMRKNDLFDINSFREALTIVLNCLGLPTFISLFIGLFTADPTIMLTAQGLLFVLMLMWVYWKTHFNDNYVESVVQNDHQITITEK